MTRFQYINKNIDHVKEEVKLGILPTSILNYYYIYSRFDYYRKLGNYVCFAVLFTSDSCKVSESTVYRAIKNMEIES
jgi:hypothetical protein